MATTDNNKQNEEQTTIPQQEENAEVNVENDAEVGTKAAEGAAGESVPSLEDKVAQLEKDLEEAKKEYLFLMAEFDNFRKRTLKEKSEIIKNGAENAMRDLLPVIDDFERALKAIDENSEVDGLKEGVDLIYNKFMKYLERNGVKPIDSTGKEFDTELHEAVTTFPAADESQKGKVVDTVQKGYTINDKVLRHARVVVGQ